MIYIKIAFIQCSKTKQTYNCKAIDMYTSTLFKYTMKYINTKDYDAIYILSAKWGLLNPSEVIESYDLSLNSMKIHDRNKWYTNVTSNINKSIQHGSTIDIYAGKLYYNGLILNNFNVNIIFGNMGIGQRLKFLKEKLGD